MGIIETRTFKSGNSVALRLPRGLSIGPDQLMSIEQIGDVLTVRPLKDAASEKARVNRLVDRLRAIGPVGEIGAREPIHMVERPGLI